MGTSDSIVHVPKITAWHGTDEEWTELIRIVARNCTCDPSTRSVVASSSCAPHRMVLADQRALDGLVFARRMVTLFCREELS